MTKLNGNPGSLYEGTANATLPESGLGERREFADAGPTVNVPAGYYCKFE